MSDKNQHEQQNEQDQDQLLEWYHKDYIPNCLLQHKCQTCNHEQEYKNKKIQQEQFCDHDQQYNELTMKNLQIYKYIPRGFIQYLCFKCYEDYQNINMKANIKIYKELNLCAYWLFNQGTKIDCFFKHMNELIFGDAIKLNEFTQNKILQIIRIWKIKQQQEMQDILQFEKSFLQFIKLQKYVEQEENKLQITGNYKQIIKVEGNNPQRSIKYASLSQKYLVYVIQQKYLYVYDIVSDNIIGIKCFKWEVTQCRFTDDEKFLFVSFSQGAVMRFSTRNNFEQYKRWFFHKQQQETIINIINLKYQQIFVSIEQKQNYDNIQAQFDLRSSKQIARNIKLSNYSQAPAYDATSNCILFVAQKDLEIFCLIQRNIIASINVNNIRYMELLGGNKILCLDSDNSSSLRLLTFNYKNLTIESQFLQDQVKNFYCNMFQEYSYNVFDHSRKWHVVSMKYGQLYEMEQKHYSYELSSFNQCATNIFVINDELGALQLCYK